MTAQREVALLLMRILTTAREPNTAEESRFNSQGSACSYTSCIHWACLLFLLYNVLSISVWCVSY